MSSLHPKKIESLVVKAGNKISSYPDGNGLHLFVYPKNKKWWRFRCRHNGKEILLSLGTYPEVSLKEARERAEELYQLNKRGINPAEHRRKLKENQSHTFKAVALEWSAVMRKDKAASTRKKEIQNLENDVFKFIGEKPINEITAPEVLEVIKRVEARSIDTAHRTKNRCSMIFGYAIAKGLCLTNPCVGLIDALQPVNKEGHFAAITNDMNRFAELLRALDNRTAVKSTTRYILKLFPMLCARTIELRYAKWGEIDFKKREWRFFITKTKVNQVIPLPRQAVDILMELKKITYQGDDSFLFPHTSRKDRPVNEDVIRGNIREAGFSRKEMSGHGFRATFKTEMLELGYPGRWIARQLGHKSKDAHGEAYDRTTYKPQRRYMMQRWANYLEALRESTPETIDALRKKFMFSKGKYRKYLEKRKEKSTNPR